QIGITLIGILSGAIGGSSLARAIQPLLNSIPALAPQSQAISIGLVVVVITYLSLIIGELVPKRLALNHAEAIASLVARPMRLLSRLAAPLVALLSLSTRAVLFLLGMRASDEPPVTEEEVRIMLAQGTEAGIFESAEQQMVENIFRLADWRTSAVMTPYPEVVWLDLDSPPEAIIDQISRSRFVAYPVFQEEQRNIVGVVLLEDLWLQLARQQPLDLKAALKPPLYVPESALVLQALEQFRQSGQRIALVIDEHSSVVGVTTPQDILEAVVGTLPAGTEEASITPRTDDSWYVDGMINIDEFEDYIDQPIFPEDERGDYHTLAGFVMMRIGRIPQTADRFEWNGLSFEVVDMDGRRVDKILVTRLPPAETSSDD
ncbi:MAG TPA: hemolysin family protein, partial [Spirillospora sp.]|nr:hemolysin family protein [Spirillospora sp.]